MNSKTYLNKETKFHAEKYEVEKTKEISKQFPDSNFKNIKQIIKISRKKVHKAKIL